MSDDKKKGRKQKQQKKNWWKKWTACISLAFDRITQTRFAFFTCLDCSYLIAAIACRWEQISPHVGRILTTFHTRRLFAFHPCKPRRRRCYSGWEECKVWSCTLWLLDSVSFASQLTFLQQQKTERKKGVRQRCARMKWGFGSSKDEQRIETRLFPIYARSEPSSLDSHSFYLSSYPPLRTGRSLHAW